MSPPRFHPDPARLLADSIAEELRHAGVRDDVRDGLQGAKKNYAENLSRALAQRFADALRAKNFPEILPDEKGRRHESRALGVKGPKKLDVNYSTPELGLGLGVSIKTIGFPDAKTKRFTKNYTARDNEFRAEAEDYHLRQPYAVLVGILFLPLEATADGSPRAPSSFASAVAHFRLRALRRTPRDRPTLFEKFFVGLYETRQSRFGDVAFFDVETDPPRTGRPEATIGFADLVDVICATFVARNSIAPTWLEEASTAVDAADDAEDQ